MNNKIIYAILGIAVIALIVSIIAVSGNQDLGSRSANSFSGTMRNSKVSITSTSVAVATSTSRAYLAIVNDGPATIWCSQAATAASSTGIRLNAQGGNYEVNANNLYQGTIACVTSGGTVTSSVTISEKR